MPEKESPSVGKKECPVCGTKSEKKECPKCGHLFRPSE